MKRKSNQPQQSKCAGTITYRPKTTEAVSVAATEPHRVSEPAVAKPRHLSMSHHSLSLLRFLNEDRNRERFCDVSVAVGGNIYKAHKVVLAQGSSYFHAELSKNPSTGRVTLDHVDESVFRHLLGFLYTSECVVAEAEVPALMKAARFLDMMEVLKLLCVEVGDVCRSQTERDQEVGTTGTTGRPEGMVREDPPTSTACSMCGRRLCSMKSLQNHMVRSHGLQRRGEPAQERPGPTTGPAETATGARRSARSRKTPAKYKRDLLTVYPLAKPKEKPPTSSAKEEDEDEEDEEEEEEEKREGDTLMKKPNPKLDLSETLQFQTDNEEEGVRMREGSEAGVGGEGSLKRAKWQQSSSEADAKLGLSGPPGAPAVKNVPQAPVYPEGLAPILIHQANKKILKCPKCEKTFDRAGKYESHTRVHTGEKPFQCDVCLQRYSTNSNLTVHKKKHAGDSQLQKKDHKCPFCSKLHASRKTLTKHVRRFHPDQMQEFLAMRTKKSDGWKCAVCLKTFTRRPHLEEHMILHSQDRPFKCTFCDQHFKSRFARLKHQEKFHLGPFPCGICGRQFNDTGNRKRHIECTHGGKRKWTCPVCGKSVRERTTLKEHLRIHSGERPHLCSICGQSFRHGSSYRLHLRMHHDDKRYECEECGKTFIRHDHLTKHQKTHSGEKAHQCEQCGKCFRRPDHLTVHYKTVHLGEKVWQKYKTAMHECEVCKKEFKGKSSLEMHFRTHSGEKPYWCSECHQSFRIKKTLTKHMVTHSDARPFNCPHCSATFKRKDKLKYHVDHVHVINTVVLDADKLAAAAAATLPPYRDAQKGYQAESGEPPRHAAAVNGSPPMTLAPIPMSADSAVQQRGGLEGSGGHQSPLSPQPSPGVLPMHPQGPLPPGVLPMHPQGSPPAAAYQAAAEAFLEKYALTPQPTAVLHTVRSHHMLDPREQSYLGTLLGLDPAAPGLDHAH
ncbi:zinc finger and BTB domain-containing protein 41 [Gadus macrocephalus]|uniref:zinc finger and BTB domain-containing protein 41 n=1 Tax=Gadus macrocephalus TaxID=80720 RepID=UPI0028CB4F1E|nr:zinc finger and BTB domain-containing protein 41 [Gadus macrocephalus]XP_059915895.1 zinc finger and BTB domain-containing protein 41 [Gadus macrocephalus]